MNYEKKPPNFVLYLLREKGIDYYDLKYYAWPETFGSTAGPTNAIGGDAMTSFTVEAFVANAIGPTVFLCAGMYHYSDKIFKPFYRVSSSDWIKYPDYSKINLP